MHMKEHLVSNQISVLAVRVLARHGTHDQGYLERRRGLLEASRIHDHWSQPQGLGALPGRDCVQPKQASNYNCRDFHLSFLQVSFLFASVRINCANLIVEFSHQSEYNQSLSADHPNQTEASSNTQTLAALLNSTGCIDQVCTSIDSQVPSTREGKTDDRLVVLAQKAGYYRRTVFRNYQ